MGYTEHEILLQTAELQLFEIGKIHHTGREKDDEQKGGFLTPELFGATSLSVFYFSEFLLVGYGVAVGMNQHEFFHFQTIHRAILLAQTITPKQNGQYDVNEQQGIGNGKFHGSVPAKLISLAGYNPKIDFTFAPSGRFDYCSAWLNKLN